MKHSFALVLILFANSPARAQFGDDVPSRPLRFEEVVTKIDAAFEPATAKPGDTVKWTLTIELIPGWHTYPTRQSDPSDDAQTQVTKIRFPKSGPLNAKGPLVEPPDPLKKAEPLLNIKELLYYENLAVWQQSFVVGDSAESGPLKFKVPIVIFACKESCLPPKTVDTFATLNITGGSRAASPATSINGDSSKSSPRETVESDDAPAVKAADYETTLKSILDQLAKQKVPANTGLWPFIVTAMFWGMVTLFTPCVFPMIPITVSFFLKQAEKNHSSALLLAFVYCGTIVVVLGAAALTLLEFFTKLSISPAMNLFLGLLFIVMALSLFGMFELTLPSFLTRFTSSREGQGGVIGTVFMALTFTVVSFTCVAPFLGGFGGMAASGQFRTWELVLGALAFAGTFAAPFFLLALFPAMIKKLPKSGGWLNTVKVVMGFLELAAALKFLRTAELILLPEPVLFTFDLVLGMWIALSILCGLYLINVFRLGHDEPQDSVSVPRFLLGFLFISLGFYLIPALFSAGSEGEKQRPRGSIYAWVDSFLLPDSSIGVKQGALAWTGDLKRAIEDARTETKQSGKQQFVFIDFTGESCANCRLNEKGVFSRAEIETLFKPFRLVQMYTDRVPDGFYPTAVRSGFKGSTARQRGDAELNRWFQDKAFGTIQLPLYVILKPLADGSIETMVYPESKINNIGAFAEFLKKPFEPNSARAQMN